MSRTVASFVHRLATVLCFAAIPAVVGAQELLVNPGLETGGSGWGSYGAAGFHNFFGANGHGSLFADNVGNFGGLFQTAIPGAADTLYEFKLNDVRIEENADASFRFGLEFYAANDSTKLGETLVPISLATKGDGLAFSMTASTSAAGVAFVRPIVQFDNVAAGPGNQRNIFVFDASLTVVPEPTSALLLGTMGVAAAFLGARKR
ncbi:MAG: PEP-CTERM sorting domain-containing protein [Lacipirellulaceae bacterium]